MTDLYSLVHFKTLDSTQDEALRRLRAGTAGHGTVIYADAQTKGRGRQGRMWEMPPKGNLAATLVCQLPPGARAGDYSILTAVALWAGCAEFLKDTSDLKIKWPNDLLLSGVKCAGILLETPEPGWVLIGTGVNVDSAPEGRAKLDDFSRAPTPVRGLLERYLGHFFEYLRIYHEGPEGFKTICNAWMEHAYGVGASMEVRTAREEFSAVFEGLDDAGACRARLVNGQIRTVHAAEVFFPFDIEAKLGHGTKQS